MIPVRCENCGAHFQTDPAGGIQAGPCPGCGEPRPFRSQPSGVGSDGTLRDMVDSDTQMDQGGNPLGEGTIMGEDGELPLGQRDNYMHSNVLAALAGYYDEDEDTFYFKHEDHCPNCGSKSIGPVDNNMMCDDCGWDEDDEEKAEDHAPRLQIPNAPKCQFCHTPMNLKLQGDEQSGAQGLNNYECPGCGFEAPAGRAGDNVPDTYPKHWGSLAALADSWKPEGWNQPEPYGPEGDRCPMCKSPNLIEMDNDLICPECNWAGKKFQELPPVEFKPGENWRGKPAFGALEMLAAGWEGNDPFELGNLRCPHCGGDAMLDRGNSEIFCTHCHNHWPVHGEGEQKGFPEPLAPDYEYEHSKDQMGFDPHWGKTADFDSTIKRLEKYNDGVNGFGQGDRDAAEEENSSGDFRIGDEWFDGADGDPTGHEAGAMEDILGLGGPPEQPAPSPWLNWTPGMHGRGLVINGQPHTWDAYDPANVLTTQDLGPHHSDYVRNAGINPEHVDWESGVEIRPTGEVEPLPGRDPSHFIAADPRLKPLEDTDMFNFSYIEPHSHHAKTLNQNLYMPWTHQADVEFAQGPLSVPNHTFMATPTPGVGIHNAHARHLQFLDAHIGGVPARGNFNSIFSRFGFRDSPEFGQPVEVKVHDPAHIIPLKQQLEQPTSQTLPAFKEMVGRMHSGELPFPPGIDPASVKGPPPAPPAAPVVARTVEAIPMAIGELGGLLGKGAIMGVGSALMKKVMGVGGGEEQQQGMPPQPGEEPNLALSSVEALVTADYETPASNPDVGTKNDNDPEKVDQKEFNDQDKSPSNLKNPNMEDSGKSGEDDVGAGIGPNTPGMERLELMLPLLVNYAYSAESGEEDPMIRSLHETLEAENPGYLDKVTPEEDQAADEFIKSLSEKPHGVHAKTAIGPVPGVVPGGDPNEPNMLQQLMQQPAQAQGIQQAGQPQQGLMPPGGMQQGGHCPQCGGVLNANGACPQCGAGAAATGNQQMVMPGGMPQGFASTAANHQGPVTPEQISAVQELLVQEGRVHEVANVPIHPEDYVREMARIQGAANVVPQVSPQEQTQPPPPPPQPGAMPMPGMGAGEAGGQPMQPMAATSADSIARRCPNCHSGTTGILDGEEGTMFCHACGKNWKHDGLTKDDAATTSSVAADNVARRCPKCHSGTTGVLDGEEGTSFCHACGNQWKEDGLKKEEVTSRVAAPPTAVDNPNAAPAAEQEQQQNPEAEEDSSLTWQDTHGIRIVPGKEYKLYNPKYEIPDVIRVERVKPDALDATIVGTFENDPHSLQAPVEITKEDMQLSHMEFEPMENQNQPEPPPGPAAPGHAPPAQTTDEHSNSYPVSSVATDSCPECGYQAITSSMIDPETTDHECFKCAHKWQTKEAMDDYEVNLASRNWINEGSQDDGFFENFDRIQAMRQAGQATRSIGDVVDPRREKIKEYLEHEAIERQERIAGRKFTPQEQRELIDEDGGVARNSDLLNLDGTHYKSSFESSKLNPDNAPDEHFSLGF